jgi:16S rRNA G966 N2-methylase RsmD
MPKVEDRDPTRYFPAREGVDPTMLQINKVGAYSISRPEHARDITDHIVNFLGLVLGVQARQASIVDGTAGVGGDTLSFASAFKRVISIERDAGQFAMLENNVKQYGLKASKAAIINGDLTKLLRRMRGDCLYMDPPWNDPDREWYTKRGAVMLYLSRKPIYSIVMQALDRFTAVVIKVPYNFDFRTFATNTAGILVLTAKVHTFYIVMCCRVPSAV